MTEDEIQALIKLLKDKGKPMITNEQMARAQYVSETARRTVWIRQRSDKKWEAIDWYGTVISKGRYRASVEADVKQMAASPVTNIWSIASVRRK